MSYTPIKIPSPRQELEDAAKEKLNSISKEAVKEVEKHVDVDIAGIKTSDLEKIIDQIKKGNITEATSIALDLAIVAATASLGGVGALFGGAVVGLKHFLESLVDTVSKEEVIKRDVDAILRQYLYPIIKNIPSSQKAFDGYKNAYKLTFPISDSANFLYGFLRTEYYEAILKNKKALPSRTGTYPKYHDIRYVEAWKIYDSV